MKKLAKKGDDEKMNKLKEKIIKMETELVNRPDFITEIIKLIEELDKEKNGTTERMVISNTLFSMSTKSGITLERLILGLTDSNDPEIVKTAYKILAAKRNYISRFIGGFLVKGDIEVFAVKRKDYKKIIDTIKEEYL